MRRFIIIALALFPIIAAAQTQHEWTVYAMGGQSFETWHGQMSIASLNVEYAKPLSARTRIGFVVSPMSIRQPKSWFGEQYGDGDENVNAISGSLVVRRYFDLSGDRLHLFGEVSSGPMWAEKRVPASTSRFNFESQAAAGFVLRPHSAMPVLIGYRFSHISNGGYAPRNPGLNVSSIMVGATFGRR
jgi:hypothetical protein